MWSQTHTVDFVGCEPEICLSCYSNYEEEYGAISVVIGPEPGRSCM